MPKDSQSKEQALVQQFRNDILRYLERRPNAADSLASIAYWWIYHSTYLENLDLLESTLDELVEEGQLERLTTSGDTIYRAGPELVDPVDQGRGGEVS